jgi:SAM-dependent methyltransferase
MSQHDQSVKPGIPGHVIDPESAAEMARLLNKSRLQTRHMGGLLPEQPDATAFRDVLDIGCGPGGWVVDMAFTYPEMAVVGVDISEVCIRYATSFAAEQALGNASFHVMDALRPLDFPDGAFDLVNCKFIAEFMPKSAWPALIRECWRLLRPGGVVRITDYEMGWSNAPAHEHLCGLYLKALYDADRIFSADGRHLGIINMLDPFLARGGFRQTDHRVYAVNYSYGAGMHEEWAQDLMLKVRLSLPFLVRMGVAPLSELERMANHMQDEMDAPNFSALWIYLTAYGTKPLPEPTGGL